MSVERTLSIVKPDGVKKNIVGQILTRFEKAGLRIAAVKKLQLTKEQAEGFYAVHKERPFFGSLVEFMTSGPVVVSVLEGEGAIKKNRDLMGATNPKEAEKGTIRADFADSIEANTVHGSDAPETAAFETRYFFNSSELAEPRSQFMAVSSQELSDSLSASVDLKAKKIDFFDLEIDEAEKKIGELAGKAFHGKAFTSYVYKHLFDVSQMLSLGKAKRDLIAQEVSVDPLPVRKRLVSKDGTVKFLLEVQTSKGSQEIECVYIPEDSRVTLCVSSQVGCKMACEFCLTAQLGFKHHLSSGDIVRQIFTVMKDPELRPVTNLVFMGMGEPFDNFENVKKAIRTLTDPRAFDISARKITVSTVGLVDKIDQLQKEEPFRLAISLNATTDEIRSKLVPINRKWNLEQLMASCERYISRTNKWITFEYILMAGLTDTSEDITRLIKMLRGMKCKLNLIPYNESPFTEFKHPTDARCIDFHRQLVNAGIITFTRKNRGNDIFAACGMLKKV